MVVCCRYPPLLCNGWGELLVGARAGVGMIIIPGSCHGRGVAVQLINIKVYSHVTVAESPTECISIPGLAVHGGCTTGSCRQPVGRFGAPVGTTTVPPPVLACRCTVTITTVAIDVERREKRRERHLVWNVSATGAPFFALFGARPGFQR